MDFYSIKERPIKKGVVEMFPDFKVCRSKDLMVRGRTFYAIWDDGLGLWSTDEYDVQRLVDDALRAKHDIEVNERPDETIKLKLMSDFSTKSWAEFRNYIGHISDNAHQLDMHLTFANTDVKKKDYVSKRLPYPLEEGSIAAYDELVGTLYEPEERAKLEWAIGAIVSGDSKDIQKFLVLYGEAGAGKSTVLNIIQKLFDGYYTTFEAKALTSNGNAFATEVFKGNPLVAIQHDGDLSKIEDNTKLNSIISHEEMTMNEKYKPSYTSRINSFLFMATNRPVKITDAKSGIIRRLIDVRPSGNKVPSKRYHSLISQIDFELGAIAHHCLSVYRDMGKNYYAAYRPLDMMMQTDVFFNFVEAHFDVFKEQNGVTLSQAYEMYKLYCEDALIEYKSPRHKFREELKSYFESFSEVARVSGNQVRSYYSQFLTNKFTQAPVAVQEDHPNTLVLDSSESLLDSLCALDPAQYASAKEMPIIKWDEVKTTLGDLNTSRVHYLKLPENHIVIDFDLTGSDGKKSLERNLEAASQWPPTYAEFSKSGAGVHLHYIYKGDATKLSRVFSEGIEIKVPVGNSSLRRKLTKCNTIPVASLTGGLPLKGEKMINLDGVKSEKGLRDLILRNLHKEIHPGTKSSMDFINKILEDAYASGLKYDVIDMRPKILTFAMGSTNQRDYCVKLVSKLKYQSEEVTPPISVEDKPIIFFDVEVFPNLFIVCWKKKGGAVVKMINPTGADIEPLLQFNLIGFNCRRYDNHILYARYIGYTLDELYKLSKRIINNSRNALFGEAYNVSYTDIYDYSAKKQSLKKFEIELGIHHQELGLPWDEPVPEDRWMEVADYCANDVIATEATHEARQADFTARLILAEISGLTPNDTTQMHQAKIMFGNDPRPQDKFNYEDLSITFPGYTFEWGKSMYRGEEVGEGGYVYSEPGMYVNVPVIDAESMHPFSIINMNFFGPYTARYKELIDVRVAIKRGDYDSARLMLNGVLAKYLDDPSTAKDLSHALKIGLNIVYGLTAASFDNKFKDPRNKDNVVAKRGALFMIDLKHAVQEKGFTVAHIKTDSIKIPNATPEIIAFVQEFGQKYGYNMVHEQTYDRITLVNDAVYIAKTKDGWSATGAQFAHPYVYKTLFTKEPIVFEDLCETKSVTSSLFLQMSPDVEPHFIGKVGSFCPMIDGYGGELLREKDGKYHAATGTKGYRWAEAEMVKSLGWEAFIDMRYFNDLADKAIDAIAKYGDFEWFVSDTVMFEVCPYNKFQDCEKCPSYDPTPGADICKSGHPIIPF